MAGTLLQKKQVEDLHEWTNAMPRDLYRTKLLARPLTEFFHKLVDRGLVGQASVDNFKQRGQVPELPWLSWLGYRVVVGREKAASLG